MEFDDWLDSIEQRPNQFLDVFTIKDLICEASDKYGNRETKITVPEVNQIYEDWFGLEVHSLEKEDVILYLRDMFETQQNPIADCEECAKLGKVCFENDGGVSHRISQYEAS